MDVTNEEIAESYVLEERKRCYDIVFERFDTHYKCLKMPGDTGKELGSSHIMFDCLIVLERIDHDRFKEWFHSLPKE